MNIATLMPDFTAIKHRQQATWATGDYAVVGTTIQIVGEQLCEAIDLRAGERVLDVRPVTAMQHWQPPVVGPS